MKNLKTLITIFALIVTAIFSSCSKDDANTNSTPAASLYRIKELRNPSNVVYQTYEYNAQNQLTKLLYSGKTWTFLYNSLGLLAKETYQGDPDNFRNYVKDFTYDNNKLLTEEFQTNGDNSREKTIYTNSTTNKLTSTNYRFSTIQNVWVQNTGTIRFTYNANNQQIVYQEDDNATVPGRKQIYTYDSSGNRTEVRTFYKTSITSSFILSGLTTYTFDNIKPENYPNSTLFKNNYLEYSSKSYDPTGTNVIGQSTAIYKYDYTPEGNVSKSYLNGALQTIYILEKIQ